MASTSALKQTFREQMHYRAPWWLPGGNLQTIVPALASRSHRGARPRYRRERLTAPDGDFVDVDHLLSSPGGNTGDISRPLLVLFHGLEGSSDSHYALAFANYAQAQGWDYAVPHFRGCSGEINLAPRAYHSGDHQEVAWILRSLTQPRTGPVWAVGVSLGGNALLRWAEEEGAKSPTKVCAVAAISAPIDLAACGRHIDRGFNRQVYVRNFLRTMQPRAALKHRQYPGLFDLDAVTRARTLYEFDDAFTAPLHGFRGTDDYWLRASAIHALDKITLPTLILNAKNDPFVPEHCLPRLGSVRSHVTLYQPRDGGHVGFAAGHPPGHVHTLPDIVGRWIQQHGSLE